MKNRIRYSGETKVAAVLRLLQGETSAVEIARDIGCHPTILTEWKDRFLAGAAKNFDDHGCTDHEKKIEELERTVGKFAVQIEFLKKVHGSLSSR